MELLLSEIDDIIANTNETYRAKQMMLYICIHGIAKQQITAQNIMLMHILVHMTK